MKNFVVDSFLKIGGSHKICEDYVLTGSVKDVLYMIVADGCSSSDNTEMGARILAHLAKSYIIDSYMHGRVSFLKVNAMSYHIIYNAQLIAKQFKLSSSCLDSTLIVGIFDKRRDLLYVYMYGDGVIMLEDKEDNIKIIDVDYDKNAPYYLSYKINDDRDRAYHDLKIEKRIRTRKSKLTEYPDIYVDDTISVAYDFVVPMQFHVDDFKTIMICSDGIQSFVQKSPGGLITPNIMIVANQFLALKNRKGEFLKRRATRALKYLEQSNELIQMTHYDDLSIGALTYEEK